MRATTQDKLRLVATTYDGAVRSGNPHPAKAVAQRLGITPDAARAAVARARRAGFLTVRPAHFAATATILRGTKRERSWQVCGTCLTSWPCVSWRSGD